MKFGVNIDKLIEINRIEPASFKQFSVSIIPATVAAFGFNLERPTGDSQIQGILHTESFSQIDWFMILKLVNASKDNLIIENIQAECIGKNGYRCKSNNFPTQIFEWTGREESDTIDQLLNIDDENWNIKKRILFLPFLLKNQSEKLIRVDFVLETYKRVFLNYWRPISFRREEIKEPETYQRLLQKAVIRIRTNENRQPLLLKI